MWNQSSAVIKVDIYKRKEKRWTKRRKMKKEREKRKNERKKRKLYEKWNGWESGWSATGYQFYCRPWAQQSPRGTAGPSLVCSGGAGGGDSNISWESGSTGGQATTKAMTLGALPWGYLGYRRKCLRGSQRSLPTWSQTSALEYATLFRKRTQLYIMRSNARGNHYLESPGGQTRKEMLEIWSKVPWRPMNRR